MMAGAMYFAARIGDDPSTTAAPGPVAATTAEAPDVVDYPEFTLKDLDGQDRQFSEWAGRHRLLNFWATWCAPCRREIPLLKEFQAEQDEHGILVMGIAVDFMEEVQVYAEAAEFNYPILVGELDAMEVAESSGISFIAMPFTMIVTREGQFVGAYLGELHRPHLDEIASILAKLDSGEIDIDAVKGALELL